LQDFIIAINSLGLV